LFKVAYTPPITSIGPLISTKKIGSWNLGSAHKNDAKHAFLVAGEIWFAPLWIESVCKVASNKLYLTPLCSSNANGPDLVNSWNAELQWSLISFNYWIALVQSMNRFGPLPSGPNDHIFLACSSSQLKSFINTLALALTSCDGYTFSSSINLIKSSWTGSATMNNLLCLFGDFAKHCSLDFSIIVSLYDTIGSSLITGTPAKSHKSLYKISTCNSPEPAIICSPSSVCSITANGSVFLNLSKESINFCKLLWSLTLTEILTTGDTVYFIALIG